MAAIATLACSSRSPSTPGTPDDQSPGFVVVAPPAGQDYTYPSFIRADGAMVVGIAGRSAAGLDVFVWSASGGRKGHIDWLHPAVAADDGVLGVFDVRVSDNGATVMGGISHQGANALFVWTAATGTYELTRVTGVAPIDTRSGLSGDGRVGFGSRDGQAFRFTPGGDMTPLGSVPGHMSNVATAISKDGQVIVGNSVVDPGNSSALDDITRAFRWTADTGMVALDLLPGTIACETSGPLDDDGSQVFGRCVRDATPRQYELFRWSVAVGLESLGAFPAYAQVDVLAVAGNGDTMIARLMPGAPPLNPDTIPDGPALLRWTPTSGLTPLEVYPGLSMCGAVSGEASLSGDGTTVVAVCTGAGVVRWSEAGPVVPLAPIDGFSQAIPSTVSDDGRVVAGVSRNQVPPSGTLDLPVIWMDQPQPRAVEQILVEGGVVTDLGGVVLRTVDVSGDGHRMMGKALDVNGQRVTWIAPLP